MSDIREIRITGSVNNDSHLFCDNLVFTDAKTNQEIREVRAIDLFFELGCIWNAATLTRAMVDSEGIMYDDEGQERLWNEPVIVRSININ